MYRPHHWLNLSEILTADLFSSKDPGKIFGWKSDKDQGQGHHFCKYHIMGHNFWTGSRRNFWLVGKHSSQNGASVSFPQILTYDVTFSRYVTSKKKYDFFTFSKIFNSQPIPLKIYTHISWTYPMYLAKHYIDQKNVTYVFMATKNHIIKYREFLHVSLCYISANNEHSSSKCTPVMHGNMVNVQNSNYLEMSTSRSNT